MLVTRLVLIQIFSKRMLVDWPKCGSELVHSPITLKSTLPNSYLCCGTQILSSDSKIQFQLFNRDSHFIAA